MGGWEIGEGVGWAALGFGDYLDAGLPVAKSALYHSSPGLFLARATAATTLLGLLPKTASPWAWHLSSRSDILDLFGRGGAEQQI
jgi:hypothetical protein